MPALTHGQSCLVRIAKFYNSTIMAPQRAAKLSPFMTMHIGFNDKPPYCVYFI